MDRIRFHIVHSVKGGCGKTAFSLFKAMGLAASAADASAARVLLLDADLKGSGLKTLIYAKDRKTYENMGGKDGKKRLEEIENLMKRLKDQGEAGLKKKTERNTFLFRQEFKEKTVNDFLEGQCEAISDIVAEGAVFSPKESGEDEDQTGFNGYLDFIFCSPRDKDKKALRYECGEQPLLDMGKFRLRMRKLLKGICGCGADDGGKEKKDKERGQYTDVVIDMPAGDDGYALVLLELLRRFAREREEKDELYYYVLTSGDRSHLDAAVEILIREMEDSSRENPYDKIHLVYNEVHEDEFGYYDEKQKETVLAPLKASGGNGGSKIVEIKNRYQESYYEFCRSDMRSPFSYEVSET